VDAVVVDMLPSTNSGHADAVEPRLGDVIGGDALAPKSSGGGGGGLGFGGVYPWVVPARERCPG
jgi:hypothetical protein